jgi:UDP-N-acetylglucosamine:LPS N-acetylglucosamine transferase
MKVKAPGTANRQSSIEDGPRVLAVSSGGGHWVQLLRLRPAMEGCPVLFVTVSKAYRTDVPGERFRCIPDATRWNKLKLVWMAAKLALIMLREWPDVVISTGAAPGYFAMRLGRLMRAKTIWIDSIANIEQLSLSGQMVCGKANLVLTQWPHLAQADAPLYRGSVL